MTGPEYQPAATNFVPGEPASPQPSTSGFAAPRSQADPAQHQPYGAPVAPLPRSTRRHDGSYVIYPGDPGYPVAADPAQAPHHPMGAVTPDEPYSGQAGAPSAIPACPPHGEPTWPVTMPASVRAAQVISWVCGGLGIALVAILIANDLPEAAGAAIAGFLPFLFLAIFAFGFTSGGAGIRGCAIAVACLEALCGAGSISQQTLPGPIGMVAGAAIAILLAQASAQRWFARPH
ncbi:hypothetical protein ACWF82_04985 [Nocardia sp. NPDC055053]